MSIYQHFRREEHAFVDQAAGWKQQVIDQYSPKLTGFLDPRQQEIAASITGTGSDVRVSFYGGHPDTERKRALFYPDYYVPEPADYEVVLFEIDYPSKFVTIGHPQVLGALMNIGLKREKFGDIIQNGERIQFVCAADIAPFAEMNLTKVGKASVKLSEKPAEEMAVPEVKWKKVTFTVSSMRLDVVAAELFNLSRAKSKALIEGEMAKVNWKVAKDPSMQLQAGDMISLRGKGRARLFEEEGRTKKDKIKLLAGYPSE
ncbi:RNA-binding protein [Alteribacter natronophilus]|uniref:YlmH family RNA-binding protein n=1 Tax=Alteribacter natronophilus TaxID=2583810 RepID=UPI00110E6050|nr:RNA-binding protein [Alteribacter natronophilus]TMW73141.1 RNA-binding protein [Alteribacter natronophilus]